MLVTIKNETVSAVISTAGAEIKSFKRPDGFEILWQGDPKYWAGQAPVLFPIVGALRNGKVKIKGDWYEMGRHGFARRQEFAITAQTESMVEMTLTANEASKAVYPFDFEFKVTYTCTDCGVETKFTVKNPGNETLPFVVGGHPAYNNPVTAEGEVFEDYNIEFEVDEEQCCPEIDLKECLIDFTKTTLELKNEKIIPLRHNLFYRDALVFENYKSKYVRLVSTKTGKGIEMDISQFPMLGIWSCVNDGPYVALEPWVGCATLTTEGDDFEEKHNMVKLPAGEEVSYAFTTKYF